MENGIPGKLRPWELGHVDLKTATIAAQNLVTADRDHQDHDELRFLYTNPQIQVILCESNITVCLWLYGSGHTVTYFVTN